MLSIAKNWKWSKVWRVFWAVSVVFKVLLNLLELLIEVHDTSTDESELDCDWVTHLWHFQKVYANLARGCLYFFFNFFVIELSFNFKSHLPIRVR